MTNHNAAIFFCLLLCASLASSDTGYFWHVTDFHYDHTYLTAMLSCNADVPKPGKYGDYWCDPPWILVEDSIAGMAHIKSNVDFILWTGDNVAHIDDANLTLHLNLEIVENITAALNKSFPQIPTYATLGNHDFYPANQASYNESEIYVQVAKMWEDWIRNQSQVKQFQEGGYYTANIGQKLRLLSLNTNLYYTANKLTANIDDPAGQLEWMTNQLKDARSKEEKVIVAGHVPPSMLTPGLTNWFYDHHKTHFVNILLEYSDVIVATFFGHDHTDGFKIIQDESGIKAVTQFTAPSVTPWRYRSAKKDHDAHNPGIRLVQYDRTTGRHINYEQFYINLTDSNQQENTKWARLYSFLEAYNVSDMSVSSLKYILSNMANDKGTDYSSKYCTYSLVSNYPVNCSDENRADVYCGGLYFDLKQAQACKQKYLDALNGASILSFSLFLILGLLLVQIKGLSLQ